MGRRLLVILPLLLSAMITTALALNFIKNVDSSALKDRFSGSFDSFPHLIWDNFLLPEAATAVSQNLPPQDGKWLQVPVCMILKSLLTFDPDSTRIRSKSYQDFQQRVYPQLYSQFKMNLSAMSLYPSCPK